MGNWKVWTTLGSVFITGIIVGVVGVGVFMQHHFEGPREKGHFRERVKARMMEDIIDEVEPAPSAIPVIAQIIDEAALKLDTLRQENRPKFKAVFNELKIRISAELTPEQTKRFEELIDKRRKGRFGFLRLPPPPPHLD